MGKSDSASATLAKIRAPSELTDEDRKQADELSLGKGPFSKPITECAAMFNTTDWKEKKRDKATGLVYSTRASTTSNKQAIRFTSTIPNCDCTALEAVLMQDPDLHFDPKNCYLFKVDGLLKANRATKYLSPNVLVNVGEYKSPVWGVAPRQMQTWLTYGNLFTPEQQEALKLRPKSATGLDDGLMVFAQCGIEYTGNDVEVPKGHERSHAYTYLVMGQDEKDGSLTLTLVFDIDIAGKIPAMFADVANEEQYKKAVAIHKLVEKTGKKKHIAKPYENTFEFDLFVDRDSVRKAYETAK